MRNLVPAIRALLVLPLLLGALSGESALAASGSDPVGTVEMRNLDLRMVSVSAGSDDGITAGLTFAVLGSCGEPVVLLYPRELQPRFFWSATLDEGVFSRVRTGMTVVPAVGLTPEQARGLREEGERETRRAAQVREKLAERKELLDALAGPLPREEQDRLSELEERIRGAEQAILAKPEYSRLQRSREAVGRLPGPEWDRILRLWNLSEEMGLAPFFDRKGSRISDRGKLDLLYYEIWGLDHRLRERGMERVSRTPRETEKDIQTYSASPRPPRRKGDSLANQLVTGEETLFAEFSAEKEKGKWPKVEARLFRDYGDALKELRRSLDEREEAQEWLATKGRQVEEELAVEMGSLDAERARFEEECQRWKEGLARRLKEVEAVLLSLRADPAGPP